MGTCSSQDSVGNEDAEANSRNAKLKEATTHTTNASRSTNKNESRTSHKKAISESASDQLSDQRSTSQRAGINTPDDTQEKRKKTREQRKKELQERKRRERQQLEEDKERMANTRVFGVPVKTAAERSDSRHKLVPVPVSVCMAWIAQHGLDETGLFRVPGSFDSVKEYKRRFDLGEYNLKIPVDECVENVASIVVRYLMDLEPEGGLQGRDASKKVAWLREAKQFTEPKTVAAAKKLLLELEPACAEVLRQIVAVLNKASQPQHAANNQMSAKKFSLCTFPNYMDVSSDSHFPRHLVYAIVFDSSATAFCSSSKC